MSSSKPTNTYGQRTPTSGRGSTVPARDRALVERIGTGDEAALLALYDRQSELTYSLAYRMLGDRSEAEEVVASAFAQVRQSAREFDTFRGSVGAWLNTIVRSLALERLRSGLRSEQRVERGSSLEAEAVGPPTGSPEVPADGSKEVGHVREAVLRSLSTLPELQRQVLYLAYFDGLTQSEIALATDQPLGTVRTRMRTALEKLRQEAIVPGFRKGPP